MMGQKSAIGSFLDKVKPKCFHTSAVASSLSHIFLAFASPSSPSLFYYICANQQGAKDDGNAWSDRNCSSHFLQLTFTATENQGHF